MEDSNYYKFKKNDYITITDLRHSFLGLSGRIESFLGKDQDGNIYLVLMDNGKRLKLWEYAISKTK